MNNKAIIGIVVGTFVVVCVALFLQRPQPPANSNETPLVSNSLEQETISPELRELEQGGNSYIDPTSSYNFLYPNDYTLDTQDPQHVRIVKRGETFRPQGEITDGVLMVFETIDLQSKTLEAEVDARLASAGSEQVIEPKEAVVLKKSAGYTYELGGFGGAQYYVLQKDSNAGTALVVTILVSDPQQKGYQAEVEAILSTVEVLK